MNPEPFTLQQRPDRLPQVHAIGRRVWPEFMHHEEQGALWGRLFEAFGEYQLVLCDAQGSVIAVGHTVPVFWDGTREGVPAGYGAAIRQGVLGDAQGRAPNTLSALAAIVAPERQGQGLSPVLVQAMAALAADHGFHSLIAPVRPTLKHRYPLTPMERYVTWKQHDGWPFDPWLRVHFRLGAELLGIAPHSCVVTGTIAEWEAWTGMRFPESGPYVVDGALVPVEMDCEQDRGRYVEPNVWMRHPT